MAIDIEGMGDSAKIYAPNWVENARIGWLGDIPPCPTCSGEMHPLRGWNGKNKPMIKCDNIECQKQTKNGYLNPDEWEAI